MSDRSSRDVLLRAEWGEGLTGYGIIVRDRLAPGGTTEIPGRLIEKVGRAYLELAEARIPFHRILRIEKDGAVIWSRDPR